MEALSNIDINCMDVEGLTPLHHACYTGSRGMVQFLISKGADIATQDTKGNTPLHIAARYGFTGIIAMLREAGGDMHAVNFEGVTPLIAIEARLERLRKEKEESFKKPERTYVKPQDWGTRSADEWSDHNECWCRRRWDLFTKSYWDRLLKKFNDEWKREQEKQNQEEKRNQEAKRILEEIAKDKAQRERVLQKKGVDRYKRYEISWKKFSESSNQFLGYSDVPFPVEKGKEVELSRIVLHNAPPSKYKQLLRKEILRWHPDKFLQKYHSRLRGSDLERVRERVNELSQALHQLYRSI